MPDATLQRPSARLLGHIKSPRAILLAVIVATLCGLIYPEGGKRFLVLGTVYLALMKMVILPFVLTGVMVGIGALLGVGQGFSRIVKIIAAFFFLTMASAMVAGITTAALPPAGVISAEKLREFGKVLNQGDATVSGEIEISMVQRLRSPNANAALGAQTMVEKIIPGNIFSALAIGDTIKVLVFSLLFGFALSKVDKDRQLFSSMLKSVELACMSLMGWFNTLLPFALFVMIYDLVATAGVKVFILMSSFLLTLGVAGLVFVLLSWFAIYLAVKRSKQTAMFILRTPLIMAAATQNAMLTIPAAVSNFGAPGVGVDDAEIVYPLGLSLCRFGSNIFYVVATVFVAQIYTHDLGLLDWASILGFSMLAGLASTGASGALMVSMLALVCTPLGLPVEAAIVLFLSVEPISDMFRTSINVAGNLAATTMSGRVDGHATLADGQSPGTKA